MTTHLWEWMKICMKLCYKSSCITHVCTSVLCLSAEYSKRVYQGVRVKHTVKDLLAEKRSRQTNGPRYSVSTTSSKPPVSPAFIFLYQTKRHGWRSLSGTTGRFPENKKSPPLVYIEAHLCALTIHGRSFDHLYLACKAIL